MPRVKCIDCEHYKMIPGLIHEPLGNCENQNILDKGYYETWMYNGHNWRANNRDSNVLRYCRGFKPRAKQP